MTITRLFAADALLPEGWRKNVRIDIEGGFIKSVAGNATAEGAEHVAGPLIPGMCNVHSHAFQRAMAGLTEHSGLGGDNFWAWRELMYKFLARITPEDNEAIATQLYIEMLKAGYTSVVEFHYLHRDEKGTEYARPIEMAERIMAAANTTRIGLTLVPVFYAHATFGGAPPNAGQTRFIHDVDSFNLLLDDTMAQRINHRYQGTLRRVGIAPHSLRAATPGELKLILAHLDSIDPAAPIHIHAAEQLKEVNDCLTWSHKRPVAWLLDNAAITTMKRFAWPRVVRWRACVRAPRRIWATVFSTRPITFCKTVAGRLAATAMSVWTRFVSLP
jgi:formimidoylglutamate deiminase